MDESSTDQDLRVANPVDWFRAITPPPPRHLSARPYTTFLTFLGCLLLSLNLYAPAHPNLVQRLLASLIILLASCPTLIWLSTRIPGGFFLSFFGAIYAAHYALPIFLRQEYMGLTLNLDYFANTFDSHNMPDSFVGYSILGDHIPRPPLLTPVPVSFIEQALALSLLGLAILYLGYYALPKRAITRFIPQIMMHWKRYTIVQWLSLCLGIFALCLSYIELQHYLPLNIKQFVVFPTNLGLLSIAILLALQLTGRLSMVGRCILWLGIAPGKVLMAFAKGQAAGGYEVILLMLMIYAALRQRLPWKGLAVAILIFLLSRPVQAPFRYATWGGGPLQGSSAISRVTTYISTARAVFTAKSFRFADAVNLAVTRLDCVTVFAEVIRATPAKIPYWRGRTYYNLLFAPIPRLLYPDKPKYYEGIDFGHRYGFLHPDDLITAVDLAQLVELYANYGVLGILSGMFFFGILYRALQSAFIHPSMGLGALAGGVLLFTKVLWIEAGTAQVYQGVVWLCAMITLVQFLMKIVEYWVPRD